MRVFALVPVTVTSSATATNLFAGTSFGAWLSQRRKALDQIMDTDYPAFEGFARLGKDARRLIVFGAGDGATSWRWSPHQLTNLPAPPTALIGRD